MSLCCELSAEASSQRSLQRSSAVCSSSARAAPAGGRPRPGRPLPASYVPGPVPNRPSTYSLCASPLAHARRRRCQPGWSPWPRSRSRPTNQRRSAVRCARGLRPPFYVSSQSPLSPRGPPLRRPLVVVPRLTVWRSFCDACCCCFCDDGILSLLAACRSPLCASVAATTA